MLENIKSNGDDAANEFVESLAKHYLESKQKEKEWIESLIEQGYKAAHPDDGWVNREENYVQFSYADFNLNPQVGDLVALGRYDGFRTVRITEIKDTGWGRLRFKYYFEKV
jgi:hypothetical protein